MGVYCRAGGCWSITLIKLPVSCLCIVGRNWKYTLKTAEEKAWVILLYTKEDTEGKKGCYRAETELWMELMSLVWGQWARRQKINHSLERHSRSVCLWKEQWWWQDWQGAVLHAKLWELVRKLGGGGCSKDGHEWGTWARRICFCSQSHPYPWQCYVMFVISWFTLSKGGMAVRYTVAQSKRYKQTERKAHMVQSVYWRS